MRIIASICLLASLVLFAGCGNDPGSADVEGKPALKADPNTERVNPAGSSGMAMDPTQMMLMRMDKNRDGNITKDELPDGGLDGYDLDGDGTIDLVAGRTFGSAFGSTFGWETFSGRTGSTSAWPRSSFPTRPAFTCAPAPGCRSREARG